MKRQRDPLFDEADKVIAFDTPDGDDGSCSRFVKTSLRNSLSGPFLFLDCDTLVSKNLSELFCIDTDIGSGSRSLQGYFRPAVCSERARYFDNGRMEDPQRCLRQQRRDIL
jgi:hypothetical protein